MSETRNATVYTAYLAFKATENFSTLPEEERQAMAQEAEAVLETVKENEVTTRGVYLTTGFRADTDFMLWWIAPSPQAIQAGLRLLNRTRLGRRIKASWSFMGLVRPAEFHRDHSPAFLRGEPTKGDDLRLPVHPHARVVLAPGRKEAPAAHRARRPGRRLRRRPDQHDDGLWPGRRRMDVGL